MWKLSLSHLHWQRAVAGPNLPRSADQTVSNQCVVAGRFALWQSSKTIIREREREPKKNGKERRTSQIWVQIEILTQSGRASGCTLAPKGFVLPIPTLTAVVMGRPTSKTVVWVDLQAMSLEIEARSAQAIKWDSASEAWWSRKESPKEL